MNTFKLTYLRKNNQPLEHSKLNTSTCITANTSDFILRMTSLSVNLINSIHLSRLKMLIICLLSECCICCYLWSQSFLSATWEQEIHCLQQYCGNRWYFWCLEEPQVGKKLQKNVTVKGEACILIHLYLLSSHLKTIGIWQ